MNNSYGRPTKAIPLYKLQGAARRAISAADRKQLKLEELEIAMRAAARGTPAEKKARAAYSSARVAVSQAQRKAKAALEAVAEATEEDSDERIEAVDALTEYNRRCAR